MRSFGTHGGHENELHSAHDPVRWADMPNESLGAAGKLLVSPPPINALPGDVAMRVRANVLRIPAPSHGSAEGASKLTRVSPNRNLSLNRKVASLKLGGIAIGAALFGAAAMTAVSSVQEQSELRVVASRMNAANEPGGSQAHSTSEPKSNAEERLYGAPRAAQHATHHTDGAALDDRSHPSASSLRASGDPLDMGPSQGSNLYPKGQESHAPGEAVAQGGTDKGNRSSNDTDTADKLNDSRARKSTTSQLTEPSEASTGTAALVPQGRVADTGESGELELLTETETIERPVVRPQFRRVTAARKQIPRITLSSLEEETLLLEQARSKLGRAPDEALALALDHQSRFRQGQLFEQRRMIHLEALLRLGRDDEAEKLASSIGSSIYQARAQALLVRYGIVAE